MKKIVAVLALAAAGLGSSAVLAGGADAAAPSVRLRLGSDDPPKGCVGVSADLAPLGATVGYRSGGTYHDIVAVGSKPANRCDI